MMEFDWTEGSNTWTKRLKFSEEEEEGGGGGGEEERKDSPKDPL